MFVFVVVVLGVGFFLFFFFMGGGGGGGAVLASASSPHSTSFIADHRPEKCLLLGRVHHTCLIWFSPDSALKL